MVIFRLAGFHCLSPSWPLPPPAGPLPPLPLLPAAPLLCALPPLELLLTGSASVLPFVEPFFCALPPAGCCKPLFCARTACNAQLGWVKPMPHSQTADAAEDLTTHLACDRTQKPAQLSFHEQQGNSCRLMIVPGACLKPSPGSPLLLHLALGLLCLCQSCHLCRTFHLFQEPENYRRVFRQLLITAYGISLFGFTPNWPSYTCDHIARQS